MADPKDPSIDYAALAARYLELWQEQVAKLGQDPAAAATYMDAWSKMFGAAGVPNPFAGLMPHVAPAAGKDRTASAAPAHGGGDLDHAALLRRLDALERRLATLEAVPPTLANPLPNLLPRALAESQSPPAKPDALDPARLIAAVTAAAKARMEGFVGGVARYHAAPAAERPDRPAAVWTQGAASLRFYGGSGAAVVVVPSLINRADILDLATDRSFLRDCAHDGLATYLLDWDVPGATERDYTCADYITRVIIPALTFVHERHGRAAHLVGYCMGGTLAMAPAVMRPDLVERLVLLAAPWDFHADNTAARKLLPLLRPMLEVIIGAHGAAPVDLLQALFAVLDPTLVGRKFRGFAALPDSDEARRFVALEDWLNDGIPLVGPVARECLFDWYGANTPGTGRWCIAGTTIDPARLRAETLVVVPAQDRIVPPASARALGATIPRATLREVSLGHIGMIAGSGARERVTRPVTDWLKAAQ